VGAGVVRACEAITFECGNPITETEVCTILSHAPGVEIVQDEPCAKAGLGVT
jgi:aspartate-semialdehyde dehydrogenase